MFIKEVVKMANRYDDVYLNPFGNVVFVKRDRDLFFMLGLRGKREIDVMSGKTYFVTTWEEIKKLPDYENIKKQLAGG